MARNVILAILTSTICCYEIRIIILVGMAYIGAFIFLDVVECFFDGISIFKIALLSLLSTLDHVDRRFFIQGPGKYIQLFP